MTISHGEEVTVLESTEMRHRDPSILIGLVRVGRSHTCFCGEGKFGHTVREHLLRVRGVVRERLVNSLTLGLRMLDLNRRLLHRLWLLLQGHNIRLLYFLLLGWMVGSEAYFDSVRVALGQHSRCLLSESGLIPVVHRLYLRQLILGVM